MAVLMASSNPFASQVNPRGAEFWGVKTNEEKKGNISCRARLAHWRFNTYQGIFWGWLVLVCNVASAVMFVLREYCVEIIPVGGVDGPFQVQTVTGKMGLNYDAIVLITYALTWIYLIDLFVRLIGEADRVTFFVHWRAKTGMAKLFPIPTLNLMDLLAICIVQASFFIGHTNDHNARYDLSVFATVRFCYVINFAAKLSEQKHQTNEITSQVPQIINTIVDTILNFMAIVFIGGVVFMHIENWSVERDPKLEFFECIYFIVTTLTTVGYGDISPSSNLAQGFTILLMFYLLLVLFPLIETASSEYSKVTRFNSEPAVYDHQPVILWQSEGEMPVDKLDKITSELWSICQAQKVCVCLVGEAPPSDELADFLNIARTSTVHYLQGSLMSDEFCNRAGLQYAKTCILMPPDDCPASDMLTQDEALCIMGMRVRQFADDQSQLNEHFGTHPLRVILGLNKGYNAIYFENGFYGALPQKWKRVRATVAISIREVQMQCLAKGLMVPGFAPFMGNLGSMRGEYIQGSRKRLSDQFEDEEDRWLAEYFKGADKELYGVMLSPEKQDEFQGVPMPHLSAILYYEKNVPLFQYHPKDHADRKGHYKTIASNYKASQDASDFLHSLTREQIDAHPVMQQMSKQLAFSASFNKNTSHVYSEPLSEEVSEAIAVAYEETSFKHIYGEIPVFSLRHFVHDPELRPKTSDGGAFDPGMEGLCQEPGSVVMRELKDHIIILVQHLEHVAHFVRVLRTVDVPEDQQQAIVIVTLDKGNWQTHTILRMFKSVYVVEVPECDHGFVSVKTLSLCNLHAASQMVMTASADSENTDKLDYHKMCLRMFPRELGFELVAAAAANPVHALLFESISLQVATHHNPNCVCTMEVESFQHARYYIRGNKSLNAFSSSNEMTKVQSAIMSSEWINRSDAVNRAASIASGFIVEEILVQDEMMPLLTTCVHKSADLNFMRALLGGSVYDYTVMSSEVPERFLGKSYMDLTLALASQGKIPLALYRTSKIHLQKYIYTNPDRNTELRKDDIVWVSESHADSNHGQSPSKSPARASPALDTTKSEPNETLQDWESVPNVSSEPNPTPSQIDSLEPNPTAAPVEDYCDM